MKEYLEEVTNKLHMLADMSRVQSAKKDKNSSLDFLPIRVPILRSICKSEFSFLKFDEIEILKIWDYIWKNSNYFEVMSLPLLYYEYKGTKISYEFSKTILKWSIKIENWAHCDGLATILSNFCDSNNVKILKEIMIFNNSVDIWKIRLSIVSLVHYTGKNSVYLSPNQVFPFLSNHIDNTNKYVSSAIGWVLREMRTIYPREVQHFISNNTLNIHAKNKLKIK